MPTVPNLDFGSVQAEGLPGRPNPRIDTDVGPQDFGSGVAQGLEAVGEVGSSQEAKQKTEQDRLRVIDANTQLEAGKTAMLYGTAQPDGTRVGGAFSLHGLDAIDMPNKLLPKYDELAQGIAATLTPDQQRAFAGHIALGKQELNLSLNRYEFEESNRLASQTYANSIDQSIQGATLGWRDPQQLAKSRADLQGVISMQGDAQGWTPDERTAQLNNVLQKMHASVLQQMINDHNPQGAEAYLKAIPPQELTPALQEHLQGKVDVGVADAVSQGILGVYRTQGQAAGTKAFSALDGRSDLTDEVKDTVRSGVQKGLGLWHDEQRQKYSDDVEKLEQRIASGQANMDDRSAVWSLYREGVFGPEQAGNAIGRIEKAQQDAVDDAAKLQAIANAYKNGSPLDPKDKDTKDGVAAVFSAYTKDIAPGSTEWINRGADIAARTGVAPEPVIAWSRTQLVSGQPQDAANAAAALMRLQEASPRGIGYATEGDKETVATARMINDAVQTGTDPTVAVENARKISQMTDGQKQGLEEIYKQQGLSQNAAGVLRNELKGQPQYRGGFFSGPPDAPPMMVGEFEQLRQQYFKLTNGNAAQAADLAANDLKNTWGVSEVNGRREFMQYAPEAMHPGLTTELLRSDMETAAAGHTADPKQVKLVPTADTAYTGGQIWNLGVPDKFGAYDVIRDEKNRPIPYQIPNGQQAFEEQRQKIAEQKMAELKQLQAEARAKEANEVGEVQMQGRQLGAF